jgi:hypothetical protein
MATLAILKSGLSLKVIIDQERISYLERKMEREIGLDW